MGESVKFTLYEVFGYLLPGVLAVVAFVLFFWTAFLPEMPLAILVWHISTIHGIVLLVGCYFAGHIAQGVGNLIFPDSERTLLGNTSDRSRNHLLRSAISRVSGDTGLEEVSHRWLYRYMDEFVSQRRLQGDREIFTYREGFYRASAIGFSLLAAAFLVRAFWTPIGLRLPSGVYFASRGQVFCLVPVAISAAWISYRRFRRFAEYRVNRVLVAFLTPEKR